MQWHSLPFRPSVLFPEAPGHVRLHDPIDDDLVSVHTPSETGAKVCERQLLQAAADQGSSESGSCTPPRRDGCHASSDRPIDPQASTPCLFVPWSAVAQSLNIQVVHEEQSETLFDMVSQAMGVFHTEECREFGHRDGAFLDQLKGRIMPLENLALDVLGAVYNGGKWNDKWETLLWHMAQSCKFWLGVPTPSPPDAVQINCGGLGGGTFDGPLPLLPLHAPEGRWQLRLWANAFAGGPGTGHTTSLHELAMLMSLTVDPCEPSEALGFGRSAVLYR